MKKTILSMLALCIVAPAFALVAVPNAEAACSFNGLINSGGACARSYSHSSVFSRFDNDEDDDDVFRSRFKVRDQHFDDRYARIAELLELIRELQAILAGRDTDLKDDFDVTTRLVSGTEDNRTTLRGHVDFGDSDFADVWFEWGEEADDLDERTNEERIEDDEDGDFEETITGLDDDTIYYYRAVAEDEDGDRERGNIRRFITDDDGDNGNDDTEPNAKTNDADDVTDDSAELNGSINMNDFNDGRVFFVHGENENQVEDVEDDFDDYDDIDENGEDLQKVLVDSDLDGSSSYSVDVDDLDSDTDHYFSICVEYEDDEDDPVISCGSVEEFTTDED